MGIKLTKEMLDSVSDLSAREAARRLGLGKTTITDARAKLAAGEELPKKVKKEKPGKAFSLEQSGSSLIIESTDSVPQTKEHIEERMRARGFSPEDYTFGYRFSEWEAQTPDGIQTLFSARASAAPRVRQDTVTAASADELIGLIESYVPVREVPNASVEPEPNTFVFNFADPQFGKTDLNGGTEETVARFMRSLDRACAMLDAEPATEIIWADLGDGIENFCNTSSQRQTNDLNLVEQVRILRRAQMQGLLRLQEYAPVAHVSVPSNHAQNRVGPQAPASTAHDDWGLEVQEQLAERFADRGDTLTNKVFFHQPVAHMESLSLATEGGATLGFVHGHRSNSQDGLERWWAGQSLGRQPTADADILLVGHFHNFSLRSVGNERYIITTPSLDNGSSWFTVSRGNVATAGVLTFRIRRGKASDFIIA